MAQVQVAPPQMLQEADIRGMNNISYCSDQFEAELSTKIEGETGMGAWDDEGEWIDDLYVGVAMPNLARVLPMLRVLPEALEPLLHFLCSPETPETEPSSPEALKRSTLAASKIPQLLPPAAPNHGDRLTVVLDLDETLVHCRLDPIPAATENFTVTFEDTDALGLVYVRPFVRLFLEIAARLFELVVFTASSQVYADQVLDRLDPEGKCISARLYRQHCTEAAGVFFKDMRPLGRPRERSILVDNSPVSLMICPDNGVLVSSWMGAEPEDRELMELLLFLQECAQRPSVPEFVKARYGFRAFLEGLQLAAEQTVNTAT